MDRLGAAHPPRARALARALAPWFERAARDLPWRDTHDPYAIWVSEIMLQQTRVETVLRHWPKFMARFPTLEALARAEQEEVLAAWSGLGYYRRARLLHAGARHVLAAHDGEVPRGLKALRRVPGVGPYTAGALRSIAFDEPEALVDGNVARVRARLDALEDPAEQDARAPGHWRAVAEILRHGSPRVLAQALMELGATVCTPRAAGCERCPVADLCRARARGLVQRIPAPRARPERPESRFVGLVVRRRGRVLLVRRPDDGLLGGLWCVPLVPVRGASVGRAPLRGAEASLGAALRFRGRPAPPVRHVFTHRLWHVHPWVCELEGRLPRGGPRCWLRPGEDPPGGLPSLTRKVLAGAGVGEGARGPR